MTTPSAITQFVKLLNRECEDIAVSVDAPRDPKGEWWLDLSAGRFKTGVSWTSKWGFGVFTSDDQGFGDRPDETYSNPVSACTRICQLLARSREAISHGAMHLKELRHIVGTSQVDLAAQLAVNQAAISRMENRADIHLSSLSEYITAMGGKLELRAKFKDFEARIETAIVRKHKARE